MDTNSLYLVLPVKNLKGVIFPEERDKWTHQHSKDWTEDFTANPKDIFLPKTWCNTHKKRDKREPGLFKEEFKCSDMLYPYSKTYVAMMERALNVFSVSKETTKESWNIVMMDQWQVIAEL